MSAEQTKRPDYDSLSTEEQAFVDDFIANPSDMPVQIERRLDLDMGRGNELSQKHRELIEHRQEQYEEGDLTADDLFTADDYFDQLDSEEDTADTDTDTEPTDTDTETEADDESEETSEETSEEEESEAEGDADPDETPSKTYDELTPRQQRLLDHWVADPDENKSTIEQQSAASPGYSARIYRKYGDIRDERRAAYEQGILTDDHLNTPDPEEIVENPDADPGDWVTIDTKDQPTGTALEDAADEASVDLADIDLGTDTDEDTDTDEGMEELDLDSLEEYDYRTLQQAAVDRGIKGNLPTDEIIEELRAHESGEAEDTDVTEQEEEDEESEETESDDTTDTETDSGEVDLDDLDTDNLDQYAYRTLQKAAVERGIKGNLPMDEIIEKIHAYESGDFEPETDEETETEADEDVEETEETPEEKAPEQLELPEDEVAQQSDVTEVRSDIDSLTGTVDDLSSEVDDLRETVEAMDGSATADLEERLDAIEDQLSTIGEDTMDAGAGGGDDEIQFTLDSDQWLTVIRALATQDDDDVLDDIVTQVHA